MGHLAGKTYDAASDIPGKVLHVQQDAINSTIGRIGIGQETEKRNILSNAAYVYGTLTKDFGATLKNNRRADVGVRFSF